MIIIIYKNYYFPKKGGNTKTDVIYIIHGVYAFSVTALFRKIVFLIGLNEEGRRITAVG